MSAVLRRVCTAMLSFRCSGISTQQRQLSCSAAAFELDHYRDWEEEFNSAEKNRFYSPVPVLQSCGDEEGRGVQWVFMGSSQKRFYAARVAEILRVPYISMGTLVRQELHPQSDLYKKIASAMNEGKLVPEDIIFGLLSKRLEDGYKNGETGFILDGIPRTRIQAEILDQIADIDLVVNFKCMEDSSVKDMVNNICLHCGKPFNMSSPEATDLNPCLAMRTRHALLKYTPGVDVERAHAEKFCIYSEQIKLLEDYYREQRKLLDFQVAGGTGETLQGLLAALHLQHTNPTTPRKLMA